MIKTDFAPPRTVRDGAVCSTSEAARLLGVSSTTVQVMVERGELEAWKTRGGHRRIVRASIERLRGRPAPAPAPAPMPAPRSAALSVFVVEDDLALCELYRESFAQWGLPLSVSCVHDGMEALLLIERSRPDVLVLDLAMQPFDGFQLLRVLRARREFNELLIIVVTGLDEHEIEARGGLPAGVVLYRKPVPFDKLQGFIEASVVMKQLAAR